MLFYFVIFGFLVYGVHSRVEKYKFDINCYYIKCNSSVKVCGIREEGEGFRIRLFQDECALLNYKCAVKDNFGYNITSMSYCSQVFRYEPDIEPSIHDPCKKYDCLYPADDVRVCGLRQDGTGFRIRIFRNKCKLWEHNCQNHVNFTITEFYICNGLELPADESKQLEATDMPYKNHGLAEDILHESEDNNAKHLARIQDIDQNLDTSTDNATLNDDFYIASEHFSDNFTSNSENDPITNLDSDFTSVHDFAKESAKQSNIPVDYGDSKTEFGQDNQGQQKSNENINPTNENLDTIMESKNLIVVRGLLQDKNSANDTINQFFSATHVFDLPVKEMPADYLNETTRRRLIKIAGPLKVFIPLLSIPQNISEDIEHRPTLNSCFHKCPKKCPATYAPVCGIPGRRAREPTLMFLNHCFMDVAQCKQFYENKSPTSISSAYTETTFVFCLGDTMNYMYHFLPLLKTLQHMGRLPKKGHYQYRLQNFKIFNNLLNIKNPNLMG